MSEPTPRILLVAGAVPPARCGVGDYTVGLARALTEAGAVRIGVLTSRHEGASEASWRAGLEVLEPVDGWRASGLRRALAAARSWAPDVLHVQYPSQGYDGSLALLLGTAARWTLGVPLAVTLHEPAGLDAQVPAMAALIRSAGALITVRPNLRALFHPKLRWMIAHKQLRLIPNATPLPHASPTPERRRAIRERFRAGTRALVAYFGYVYPARGVHQLFEIADPARHCLAIVGGTFADAAAYVEAMSTRARQADWAGSCTLTGFVADEEAAEILACADAVVLPFEQGGGSWNTSLLAARSQGTFVLTTSREARGYDARENVYYARPGDLGEMRAALATHLGTRSEPAGVPTWAQVAAEHLDAYRKLRGPTRAGRPA